MNFMRGEELGVEEEGEKEDQNSPIEPSSSETQNSHTSPLSSQIYHPLPDLHSIRLLRIHRSEPNHDLILTLEPVRLDSALPAYEALSYVWGIEAGEQVICNGQDLPGVTVNLVQALKRLRLRDRNRLVWCDGLCIDQRDSVEKSSQVKLMHHIYARADRVIVLLGPDERGLAEGAFGVLCAMVNDNVRRRGGRSLGGKKCHEEEEEEEEEEEAVYETMDPTHKVHIPAQTPVLSNPIWINVIHLFSQTWFLRMWVLQEIVLAQHAVVVWGSCSIDWDTFGQAIDCIREHVYLHTILETRHLQNAFFMWNMCSIRWKRVQQPRKEDKNPSIAFLQLLDIARSFDVTDAKDKVYGLLGFPTRDASPETGVFIRPNYTQSLSDLYTVVARKLLLNEGNLDLLSFVVHKGWRENVDKANMLHVEQDTGASDLPSWVPNWNTKDVIFPFAGFGDDNSHKAGLGRPLCLDFLESTDMDTDIEINTVTSSLHTIALKGMKITTIRTVGSAMPFIEHFNSEAVLRSIISWYLDAASPSAQTLANTLCAHRNSNGRLVVDDEKNLADFMALLKHLGFQLHSIWPESADSGSDSTHSEQRSGKCLAERLACKGDSDAACETMWRFSCYRAPFVTATGEIGLGPGAAKPGDVVVVLWGGQLPFVLRRRDNGGQAWTFVGDCYVEKYMSGNILDGADEVFELR